ncbi:MAG: hypothetical protein JNM66_10310, partial [Bryobacterales bacterium]|nr:hypothetical protein [Bryobacterales bacterium]
PAWQYEKVPGLTPRLGQEGKRLGEEPSTVARSRYGTEPQGHCYIVGHGNTTCRRIVTGKLYLRETTAKLQDPSLEGEFPMNSASPEELAF